MIGRLKFDVIELASELCKVAHLDRMSTFYFIYEWGASGGGGNVLNISQGNIRAIVSDNYAGTDQVYTAAGNTVWESWSNSGGNGHDVIVNIDQQQ